MIRWIYNFCFPFVFVCLLPGFLRRMVRRGNYGKNFGQRFGWYSVEIHQRLTASPSPIWIQAVSVGEMLVALKLIDALRQCRPLIPLVLSTTTTTGYELAKSRVGPNVEVLYTPLDSRGSVRRAFETVMPSLAVIVDGGLWPNFLWEAERRRIPTALVNARLSPRSESRFRRFRFLTGAMFRRLGLVGVTEPQDVSRWQSLGVPAAHLKYTGSIKFDDQHQPIHSDHALHEKLASVLKNLAVSDDQPILLAGSTHPGEERIVAETYQQLRKEFPRLFLIIVPRHFERAGEIDTELANLGLRVTRRTAANISSTGLLTAKPDVLLVDTTGELREWYAFATLVFIGKSLQGGGGQNPVEAILQGKPVILGPHMENFQDLVQQLLKANAAIQLGSVEELPTACTKLLSDASERKRLAEAATRTIAVHRGAAGRTADLLLDSLSISACKNG